MGLRSGKGGFQHQDNLFPQCEMFFIGGEYELEGFFGGRLPLLGAFYLYLTAWGGPWGVASCSVRPRLLVVHS